VQYAANEIIQSSVTYSIVTSALHSSIGGLAARVLDLRLNSHEFKTRRLLALPGSNLGQVTRTYWPSRS